MKKALGLLVLVPCIVRLVFALGYWAHKPLTHDADEYLELARNYNASGQLVYDAPSTLQIESVGRAPGYPLWLAFWMRISPSLAWIRTIETLVSVLSAVLLFLIARTHFSERASLAVLAIAAVYIPFLWLVPAILSENLWILLVLIGYWFSLRMTDEENVSVLWGMGAFTALAFATLVRPAAVFLVPLALIWTWRFRGAAKAIVGVILYLALLLPVNLALWGQEGRFVFVASEGGVTFWTGTHPAYRGDGDLASNPEVQVDYRNLLQQSPNLTPGQRESIFRQQAWQNIAGNPGRYLITEVKKLFYWFLPFGPSIRDTSLLHQI